MSILRNTVILLLLASFLATPWASAAPLPRQSQPVHGVSEALLGRAWAFLRSVWSKTGCHIDPDGLCAPERGLAAPGDTGCNIDPDGRCHS
jgi:hypothetical protein